MTIVMPPDDAKRFDAALRQRYDIAVAHISSATRAQLQQRRRAALSNRATAERSTGWSLAPWRFGWPAAAASLAAIAIVAVVQMRPASLPAPAAAPQTVANVATVDATQDMLNPLDESPDFYLWLASDEAVVLAKE